MSNHVASLLIDIIEKAKQDALVVLNQNASPLKISVVSSFDKLLNRLYHLSGRRSKVAKVKKFGPVTDFLGEKIEVQQPVKPEDLTPDEAEKLAYRTKVKNLLSIIDTVPAIGVLHSHHLPEHQLIIRGVAKLLGIEDYDTQPVDIAFIEEIQEAVKARQAHASQELELERSLQQELAQKQGEKSSEPVNEDPAEEDFDDENLMEVTVTQEILDANPELKEEGVQVGDIIGVPKEEDDGDQEQELADIDEEDGEADIDLEINVEKKEEKKSAKKGKKK